MEWYLLAGMSDVPQIDVHLKQQPERGVIGIGEPPTVSTAAAIAIRRAQRYRRHDSKPAADAAKFSRRSQQQRARRVRREGLLPTLIQANEKEARRCAESGTARRPAARRRPGSPGADEGLHPAPDRMVNVKNALEATVVAHARRRTEDRRRDEDHRSHRAPGVAQLYPAVVAAAGEVGTPQIRNSGHRRRQHQSAAALLVLPQRGIRLLQERRQPLLLRRRARISIHAIFGNNGPSHIVHPSNLAVPFVAYGATFRVVGAEWRARSRRPPTTSRCRRLRTC